MKHFQCQIYVRLAEDPDRRIREACHQTFIVIARSVKKELAPYLKQIMPYWLRCLFDPSQEVSIAARNALNVIILWALI